ncbi:MAG: hypothetical protein ACREQV_25060 [Candidatus Binatia bacterium]
MSMKRCMRGCIALLAVYGFVSLAHDGYRQWSIRSVPASGLVREKVYAPEPEHIRHEYSFKAISVQDLMAFGLTYHGRHGEPRAFLLYTYEDESPPRLYVNFKSQPAGEYDLFKLSEVLHIHKNTPPPDKVRMVAL